MEKLRISYRIAILLCFVYTIIVSADKPKANPSAMVILDDVRFTILTPQLIRMEWGADRTFEDHASFVFINRNLPVPRYDVRNEDEWVIITTEKVQLRYKKNSGKFIAENLSIAFTLGGKQVIWRPGMEDPLNLKGTTRTLDGTNGEKDVNLEQGILSRSGWSLIDDSNSLLFDNSDWSWVIQRPIGERQDWYFLGYGHDYKNVLFDFTQVAGKIPIPPRFAFGYWWSRYWAYSDSELRKLVAEIKGNDIPLDVLIIDMDWHKTYGLSWRNPVRDPFEQIVGWTGYTWERDLFPEPEKFFKWTEEQQLKTALNLHPASGIPPMEERYDGFANAIGFDMTGRPYIPFAMENKKWAETYFNVLLLPLEKMGVDFWWLDWQQWLESKTIKGLSNTWWLNYTFFTNMERRGEKRPLLFHRWGGLGNHRYQIGFSGDSWSTWEALSYQPHFTATASNVGYGYWSHDIGGHVGNDPDPELFMRWIQLGIFSPIVRTHSTKSGSIERRIWKYPQHFEMMRDALHLRYALVPYIYNAARIAHETGVSICKPMYYDYPEREEAYTFKSQYMFGEDMLIAPVVKKSSEQSGVSERAIWLPEGRWFEWFTGTLLEGDTVLERKFALHEIPVYVKAGAIIPMYPKVSNLQRQIDTLVLSLIPGGNSETNIYEDDGVTSEYTKNGNSFTKVRKEISEDGSLNVTIFTQKGVFKNMSKSRWYELRLLRSFPPARVVVNGKSYSYSSEAKQGTWTYNAHKLTAHIFTSKLPTDKKVEITVYYSETQKEKDNLLDGMMGMFSRFPKIMEMSKYELSQSDWGANPPLSILRAAATPTRIQYHPEQTIELLQEFHEMYGEVLKEIINYPRADQKILEAIVDQFYNTSTVLEKPLINLDATTSENPTRVSITHKVSDVVIRYTLDGTMPNESSSIYAIPFTMRTTGTVKAKAFKTGFVNSFLSSASFQLLFTESVSLESAPSEKYSEGAPDALVNGKFGILYDYHRDWLGFEGADLIATIKLKKPLNISSVSARFLQDQGAWIFLPIFVQYEVSSDGVDFRTIFQQDTRQESESKDLDPEIRRYTASISATDVTHLRIRAKNIGVCPNWHKGKGRKAWLFADEIFIESQ